MIIRRRTVKRLRHLLLCAIALLLLLVVAMQHGWRAEAAEKQSISQRLTEKPARTTQRNQPPIFEHASQAPAPAPAIEPYVRPTFIRQMRLLRPSILESAQRHNRPELSHMSNRDFAVVLALLLYNENFGSLEERIAALRDLTPWYQDLQMRANEVGGVNLSVWPANLRPSVALEILRHHVPVPSATGIITKAIDVAGSRIHIDDYPTQSELYAALTLEISNPQLAVEYLAANLERGLYRAQYEHIPVTWRTLAAWHNQGIVSPEDIRNNPTARDYIRRTSAYIDTARRLIDTPACQHTRCYLRE